MLCICQLKHSIGIQYTFGQAGVVLIVITAVKDSNEPAWHEDTSAAEVTVIIPVRPPDY